MQTTEYFENGTTTKTIMQFSRRNAEDTMYRKSLVIKNCVVVTLYCQGKYLFANALFIAVVLKTLKTI